MAQFRIDGFAVVTGGASGIGHEVGMTFAEAGAKGVLFADLNSEGATKAAEESKKLATDPSFTAVACKVDVTDAESVHAMVELAVNTFGKIDYCINSAGVDVDAYTPFMDFSLEEYDRVLGINAKGTLIVSQAVAKAMQSQDPKLVTLGRHGPRDLGRGSIVNIASANSHVPVPAKVAYVASKHAVLGITKACALECRDFGVRVNQVSPTWVRTPMFAEECKKVPPTPQIVEAIMPNKRVAETDEVASAALYLCSPAGAYVNGFSLMLDASLTIGPVIIKG